MAGEVGGPADHVEGAVVAEGGVAVERAALADDDAVGDEFAALEVERAGGGLTLLADLQLGGEQEPARPRPVRGV